MGKRKNHIDEQFRKQLRQYEASPPEEIWSGISSALRQKRRKQRIVVYWRMAASIAILFGLGTMFYFLRQEPVNPLAEQEQSADTIQKSSLPEIFQPPMVEKIAESPETGTGEQGQEAVLTEESNEHIAIRDEMTKKDVMLPVIDETTPLKYIRSYEAGLLENRGPETKLLIAQKYYLKKGRKFTKKSNEYIYQEKNSVVYISHYNNRKKINTKNCNGMEKTIFRK